MSDAPDDEPTGDDPTEDAPVGEHVERPVDKFKQSAAGSILAAGMFGLADALDWHPKQEEVAIVQEASEPERDLDIVIDLDHPERTVAILRPAPPAEN